MPRPCTICTHPNRAEIEKAIASNVSYRDVSLQFSVGHMAVQRHVTEHIAQSIQQFQETREEARGLDVVKQLKAVNSITLAILKEARDNKKNGMALFAIDRVLKQLELQAKLLGDIDKPQINIYVSPEWRGIRDRIVVALIPYPDARIAVAQELAQLEGDNNVSIG
jgi:hypothetical protein